MTDELRVPKRRVPVEVLLPGGAVRQVTVFLADFAPSHNGPERLSDLLNAHDEFFPALDVITDAMTFFGRHAIAAARVAREWDQTAVEQVPGERHEVEITLECGTQLRGTVSFVLPPERSRLLDHLNDPQPFVRLLEGERVALVNKRHIARIARVAG